MGKYKYISPSDRSKAFKEVRYLFSLQSSIPIFALRDRLLPLLDELPNDSKKGKRYRAKIRKLLRE